MEGCAKFQKIYDDRKVIFTNEEINGYKLWNTDGSDVMDFEAVQECCEMWDNWVDFN